MAKPKLPNQKKAYSALERRTARYLSLIDKIFATYNLEAAKIATQLDYEPNKPFSFGDFPQTRDAVSRLQINFASDLTATIVSGINAEWKKSDAAQSHLKKVVQKRNKLAKLGSLAFKQTFNQIYNNRDGALQSFKHRQSKGLNLSQRIWRQSGEYKKELEAALSLGIQKGTSAVNLSKSLTEYLNDFPRLKKEYKEKHGKDGIPKNCKFNAQRLARTEINMAYRTAEQERWQNEDYILGFEVKRSQRKENFKCDVCEQLKGRYPKDFHFVGWHPMCRCYVVPLMKTDDEFFNETPAEKCTAYVQDVPENFKQWVETNRDRIENATSLPYFIQDNPKYFADFRFTPQAVSGIAESQIELENLRAKTPKELTIQERADIRHSQRTPEQIEAIQNAWNEKLKRDILTRKTASNILRVAQDYSEIDFSKLQQYITDNNLTALNSETRSVARAISAMKRQEQALADLIPNVHELHKTRSLAELQNIHSNITRTLSKMPTDLDDRLDRLQFEMNWMETSGSKRYPTTYQISKEAYRLQAEKVKDSIIRRDFNDKIKDALSFADTSKSKSIKAIADDIRSLLSKSDYDLSIAVKKADKLNNEYQRLLKEQKKRLARKISTASNPKAETLKDLKKQLSSSMPKTLEYLQDLIDKNSSFWGWTKATEQRMRDYMLQLFENSDFGMNVPLYNNQGTNVIEQIFDTYFKSQIETGTGKGMVNVAARKRAAEDLFGIPTSSAPKEYEKYGFLMEKDILKQAHSNIANQYWSRGNGVQIRFKKDKVIATFTYEDSLGSGLYPSLTSDPKCTSFSSWQNIFTKTLKPTTSMLQALKDFGSSYIELQYHGDLTIDCIESVFIPESVLPNIPKRTLQKMFACGSKVFTENAGKLIELTP